MVTASRGKALRAEPIAALYEQLKIHHVGQFNALEDEMTSWQPGLSSFSPNRMDALVWVLTELMLGEGAYEAASAGFDSGEDPNEMGLDMWMRPRRFPRIERPWPSIWGEVDELGNGMFG